jgi:hypothetical protein
METNRSDYGVQTLLSFEGSNQLAARKIIRVAPVTIGVLKVKWAVPSPGAPLSNALEIPSTR